MEKIKNIAILLKRGKSAKYGNSSVQIIKSGQARGFYDFDFSEKYYVDKNFVLDDRQLHKEDILINSTGVGTAGRVTLFNLDGAFVVDSHITILRINQEKALPVFVLYFLAYGIGFKNIEAMAQGQSGQIELSLPIIENIKFPFLPLQEQQKIVSKIIDIETTIQNLQNQLEQVLLKYKTILNEYL
jgi:type I restriction enzyme M protein